MISILRRDILIKTQLIVLKLQHLQFKKGTKEMTKKQTKAYTMPSEFVFKCNESNFTQQEILRWSIARAISGCDDVEKLHIIDTFISRYLK